MCRLFRLVEYQIPIKSDHNLRLMQIRHILFSSWSGTPVAPERWMSPPGLCHHKKKHNCFSHWCCLGWSSLTSPLSSQFKIYRLRDCVERWLFCPAFDPTIASLSTPSQNMWMENGWEELKVRRSSTCLIGVLVRQDSQRPFLRVWFLFWEFADDK